MRRGEFFYFKRFSHLYSYNVTNSILQAKKTRNFKKDFKRVCKNTKTPSSFISLMGFEKLFFETFSKKKKPVPLIETGFPQI